ncbi:MAG: ParA family protein [Planctomycetaceae bacterium]|jgi:chromosome partitioning protein|nr:ParA family protein [Planctomycetaceae bacterium]
MVRTFCIANRKGGVGKTTTAVSLAAGLAKSGARVLLADLDPQCNATSGLGGEPQPKHPIAVGEPFADFLFQTNVPNLQLLPGCRSFASIEALTQDNPEQTKRIHEQLQQESEPYQFVLFDCPPSMGHLTQLALSASTEVLIPIQCEFFAMEGLVQMIEVIKKIMDAKPEKLEFGGVLLTMYDAGLDLTYEVEEQVRDFFGEIVFKTVIPRDAAVSEAPSHGLPVFDYAPRSRGARAYTELCMEILGDD